MLLPLLQKDRFLRKDPSQSDQTKNAVYTASNPTPKRGVDTLLKQGRPSGKEEDGGAPNVLTGTVITSCFIQTSALPSRIEMEGNDLTFFDDTYNKNGAIVGDTSRLVFTHASGKKGNVISQGFIFEKRASLFSTYDNVLSIYSPEPRDGNRNLIFIGRDGVSTDTTKFWVNTIAMNVNHDSTIPYTASFLNNGVFSLTYSVNGTITGTLIASGNSEQIFGNTSGLSGYSTYITGLGGGYVIIGSDVIPADEGAETIDIGTSTWRFGTIYANTIAVTAVTLPGGIKWLSGVGSPEGVVTAPIGSLYSNTSGGASTTLYVKTSGAGNTGWTAK